MAFLIKGSRTAKAHTLTSIGISLHSIVMTAVRIINRSAHELRTAVSNIESHEVNEDLHLEGS